LVDRGRCLVAERLVGALVVVEREVALQALEGGVSRVVIVNVDLFVFDGPPQPFV
jgi:hypothetical protein